jgi:hypothetical protein
MTVLAHRNLATLHRLEELIDLFVRLSGEEREELLECLLIAAPRGGDALIKVLERLFRCHVAEELQVAY